MKFGRRLALYCAAGIALVLVLGSAATYLIVRAQLRSQVDNALLSKSDVVVYVSPGKGRDTPVGLGSIKGLKSVPRGTGARATTFTLRAPRSAFGSLPAFVELIDAKGKPTVPPVGGVRLPVTERAKDVARTGTGAYFTDVHVRRTHLRMRVEPAGRDHALLIAQSLRDVDRSIGRLAWSLGITGAIGTLLAALVGTLVARGALRPVRRLNTAAARVATTRNLSERIDVRGDDELSGLGRTLNAMLDSLERAVGSQRRLVSDASHELRTPLTSLRTNIDVLRGGIALEPVDRERLLRDIDAEIGDLTNLVANLVELARGSQRDLHLRDVRLDEIAQIAVARARIRFPKLAFQLTAQPTTVLGEGQELERAAWNLIENAAKWSADNAVVEVTVQNGAITVRDHGPGVAPQDQPFIFDRFYRADAARSRAGSGLGLAIVRQVAESHGGHVDVENAEGGGARFRLALVSN